MGYFVCITFGLLFSVIIAKRSGSGADMRQTNKLYHRLLDDYNKDARPVADQSKALQVEFGLALVEILELDESSGHITMNMWPRMSWTDISLRWDPRDYGGVSQIHVPAKDLWLPDIVLFNGFDSKINKDLDAIITYDGTVLWVPPSIIKLTCKHEFRGNFWVCPMKFGSWTYNGDEVDVSAFGQDEFDVDISNYMSGDEWEVVEASGEKRDLVFNDDVFPVMECVLRLRSLMLGRFAAG